MIICECTGTTAATVRALARDGVSKVSEVTARCGAGGCCQSCRPAIARILRTSAKQASSSSDLGAAAVEPASA